MVKPAFEAIIFDHDGTLVDTETPDFLACQMLCQELGVTLTQEYWAQKIVGHMDGYDALFAELIELHHNGFSKEKMWQRLRQLWRITLENVEMMPGARQLLAQLQLAGYPLAVATASDRNWVTRWLTEFDLMPYFRAIACSDDVPNNKPAPDVYLFAAARLDVPPERCLVFEDSVAGAQAALSAGMTVIAVPSHITKVLDFSQTHGAVASLEMITPAWIDSLAQKRLGKE